MKKYKNILLGLVIGSFLVLLMGQASYDKTYFQHDPIYLDGFGPYLGTSSDAQMTWNASGYVDWNVTGDVDLDLTAKFTMDFSTLSDADGGFKVTGSVATGEKMYGLVYTHLYIEGTTDDTVAALRVKTSMDSSSAPEAYVYGARITIEEAGADLDQAVICPLIIETYLDAGGNNPSAHYMMRFNTTQGAETPDAWFISGNPDAVAYTANTSHSSSSNEKVGAIKIHIAGVGDVYFYLYSSAGS